MLQPTAILNLPHFEPILRLNYLRCQSLTNWFALTLFWVKVVELNLLEAGIAHSFHFI